MSTLENNPDPDKELDRKKKELENEKLAVEIRNLSMERWKFFFGFVPVVGLLVTIVVQLSTFKFSKEQHQDNLQADLAAKYFDQFNAHPNDLKHKLSVSNDACNDQNLSIDVQEHYCAKVDQLERDIVAQQKLDNLREEEESKQISEEDKVRVQEIDSLDALKEQKTEELKTIASIDDPVKSNSIKKEISSLDRQIDVIIDQSKVIQQTLAKTDSIDDAQRKLLGSTYSENSEKKALIQEESWFKEGYFRQFGETRISLVEFRGEVATISIKIINPKTDKVVEKIGSITLHVNEKESIESDEFEYEIAFLRIGSAGKNPFNKAVYFGYCKYKL